MPSTLILTVTRACNLRCSYCPTAKDGWPSLKPEQAALAVRLFADRYGGGDIKIFGGEPLLVPRVVEAALAAAAAEPRVRRVYLSTNGLGLNAAWLDRLAALPKSILTISMDGAPDDHRRLRVAQHSRVADCYDHLMGLLPRLRAQPRLVITQTIAPETAARAAQNFEHLLGLGLRRFNLLPGYYIRWTADQHAQLREGLRAIGDRLEAGWARGERLYLRNLFTWAPTPFFNTGVVVDSDATVHPSNIGLSGALDGTRGSTAVGTLDDPPSRDALAAAAQRVPELLRSTLGDEIMADTARVDAELTALCRRLYGPWAKARAARAAAGASPGAARTVEPAHG